MKEPKLVVFEGVDASGKSTISKIYLDRLKERGLTGRLISFPGNKPGTVGAWVYALHHRPAYKGIEKVTAASLQALHIASHLDAIEEVIIPSLEAGETIVLDRFWWSTWVYGMIGGVNPNVLKSLIDAERCAWGRWHPDLVFHVTTLAPLRQEPREKWEELCGEYDTLAKKEASQYLVYELSNDSTPEEAVSHAVTVTHGF